MATPRRAWFRVQDRVGRKHWSNDELAGVIRLMAFLHTRWARDGLTAREAGEASIGPADAMAISGKRRPDVAASSIEHLADISSMSVRRRGDVVEINWPNFAEFQRFPSETRADPSRNDTPSARREDARRGGEPRPGPRGTQLPIGKGLEGIETADRLSPGRVASLLEIRPKGITYAAADVEVWFAMNAPKMRARGRTDLWKTACNWWPRASYEEIEAAHGWAENQRLERHRDSRHAPDDEPGDDDAMGGASL